MEEWHNLEKAYYSQHLIFVDAGNCELYYNICSWIQQQQHPNIVERKKHNILVDSRIVEPITTKYQKQRLNITAISS